MALKIAVPKTFLPNCPSPYIVRSASSELVEFDSFVDFMAEGRTTLSRIDILAAQIVRKIYRFLVLGRMTYIQLCFHEGHSRTWLSPS